MRQLRLRLLLSLLLSVLALQTAAAAKKDTPDIEVTTFDTRPVNVLYFEDSDVILITNSKSRVVYRSADGGKSWKPLAGVEKGEVYGVMTHPTDKKFAVVLGTKKTHWISRDRGETWTSFTTEHHPSTIRSPIAFHADDPDRMLFMAEACYGILCEDSVYYTIDAFKSHDLLHEDVTSCLWAKTDKIFTTGDSDKDKNTILCIAKGKFDFFSMNNRIVRTNDFFKTDPIEPTMSDGKTVQGITNLAATKKYIVVAAKNDRTTEMGMYVSDDTVVWHRAEFGQHRIEEDAYTLLESTNYSMQVDVMTTSPRSPMGVLLTSNSNGTFFTKNIEHTNRNEMGFVDFEKLSNIQGVLMVNTVANWEEVEHKRDAKREVISQISFDDGRTWEELKADGKTLHLHSVTAQRNAGRIYSSPAPGMVLGVGNTGNSLGAYDEGDLFVSDDAGLTWKQALSKPHIYEFGAQGSILVAIEDKETNTIRWSINHGKDWKKLELDAKITPHTLTTTPDATSLKFLLLATKGTGSKLEHLIYALDFNGLHERACKGDDYEKWPARKDHDGKATCIMGHKQFFERRKADKDCVVENKNFEDPEEKREDCECMERDFECDYNFKREDGKCIQSGPVVPPPGACKPGDKKFKGTSGYRLIPGNTCQGGKNLAEEVERECADTQVPPVTGEISMTVTKFKDDRVLEHHYLERVEGISSGTDETIIMRTDRRKVWKTHDHGKKWEQILEDEEVLAIYPHEYLNDQVYLITPTKKVYYSKNRAGDFHHFEAPEGPNHDKIQVLTFHPHEKDWLIWTGGRDCEAGSSGCQSIAHVSKKHGDDWTTLLRAVRKCQFVYREGRKGSDQLVYCEQYEAEDPSKSLLLMSSDDWFDHKKELKRDVISFATMAEFIVVAVRDQGQQTLRVDASIDGVTFADAHFPKNFRVEHQQAYTVLDSSTHAVFLHVTVNNREDQQYGSIVKSNSNGTSYVLSAAEVNRNSVGYVDFEKMQGLEGVAIINRVANVRETNGGSSKKLKTYITHNDGAAWSLLGRPEDSDALGVKFDCSGSDTDKCSLHLHGYTERKDPRDNFGSPSAVGMMMGTGNVGEFLGYKKEADTFITRDGGLNWEVVAKGNWMWEYGDQGSILVIVKEDEPVKTIRYSLDEGRSWKDHGLPEEIIVHDLTTVPSDNSRNFLLWGKIGNSIATISLDFSSLKERSELCVLNEADPTGDDYDLWSPQHPLSEDNCLFGHVAEYHRKKLTANCYNGREVEHLHSIKKNCTCTRNDFECDYNYERDTTGVCRLVEGMTPLNPEEVCKKNPELIEFNEDTAYRRIPLTTCQGGQELDKTFTTHPCPGHEDEFEQKHGISGAALFFAIVIPIAAAAGVGWWVWRNWDGKFGRIRLGESGSGGAFDEDAPWVKYPVMAVSGVVAIVAALPMVFAGVWNAISTSLGRSSSSRGGYERPFTSRNSFQRGRQDYAVVDEDEGELLGEDSDEDV